MTGLPAREDVPADASARVPPWARALAVLLPLIVIAAPLAWWGRADPAAQKSATVLAMEKEVASDPPVLVLGASKVFTDIDAAQLARALGVGEKGVVKLNVSASTAPVWFAILENRVYGTGKNPKLVLVYSTFDWVLATRPVGEEQRAWLLAQMNPDDAVLRRKSLGEGAGGAGWERVRRRRTEAHSGLLGWIRNAAVGLFFAPPGTADRVASGAEIAAPALDALFGMQAGIEARAPTRAIPIAERALPEAVVESRVEDTLLPDFVAMTNAHGTRLVFVNAPVRANVEAGFRVDPEMMAASLTLLNEGGAGYLDLWDLRLGDASFGDAAHLNGPGRAAVTKVLAERLVAMGALGDGPMTKAELPVDHAPSRVTREGTPPELPALAPVRGPHACGWEAGVAGLREINDFALQAAGFGQVSPLLVFEDGVPLLPHANRDQFDLACSGAFRHQDYSVKFSPSGADPAAAASRRYTLGFSPDAPIRTADGHEAWWVYPGTTLTMEFDEAPAGGPFGVVIDVVRLGGGKAEKGPKGGPKVAGGASDPVVRVGDGPETTMTGVGVFRSAAFAAPAPTGPWRVSVRAPADGGYVLLRRLVVGNRDDARYIVGAAGGGSANVLSADSAYAAGPVALPPLGPPKEGPRFTSWDLAGLPVPDTDALWKVASVSGCSPIRLTEDGTALPSPVVRERDLKDGPGRYAQAGMTLFATASDGSSPASNGRAYAVALEATRRCRGLRWLYPGDVVTFTVRSELLGELTADATRFELGAAVVGDNAGEGTVRVRVGGDVYLDTTFSLATLNQTPPSWAFDRPVPRGPEPVTIELSIPATAPYLLLTSLGLSEPGVVPFASESAP